MAGKRKKLVIGLVGEIGAGKETFCRLLWEASTDRRNMEYRVVHVSTSVILRQILKSLNLESSRENLQTLPGLLERGFGEGTLARAMIPLIEAADASIVIYDSVRWLADRNVVCGFPHHRFVHVTADQKIRWRRVRKRKQNPGEDSITLTQFKGNEQKPTELLIPKLGSSADFKIENNGGWRKFRDDVHRLCWDEIIPLVR
jgi:dephospho-CoA kinase